MTDLKQWKRDTAVRRFREIKQNSERAGDRMSDQRIAAAVGGYVDAPAADVLKWWKGAGNV
ncbi:MAG: hypothetical protein JNM03_10635 [Sphingopyxis sp.]|uniref:hypothetical protein n=1 Tax=Sphingopyxis sp. TaxID=1908224 RepID=UPI001A4BBD89|nr:hypothetical protein [Sphingopyxis sp.]MBL9070434.1 hypothetical protein [Sphingopyxis sp.]